MSHPLVSIHGLSVTLGGNQVLRDVTADLAEGRFSVSDKVEQHGDVKSFGGSVPPEALAAGRVGRSGVAPSPQ